MASVARLCVPHEDAQRTHCRLSQEYYEALFAWPVPGQAAPPPSAPVIRPHEGWVHANWRELSNDPAGTQSASHDIVPHEVLRAADPSTPHQSGIQAICARISEQLQVQLDEYGLLERARDPTQTLHERFTVSGCMDVHIVNIVHTTYCGTATATQRKMPKLPSTWMWRRLAFLGCQENHVHTSLKISYRPPFKAVHLLFSTARVLETGAANETIAHIMFFHATLRYLQSAGVPGLYAQARASQNVVAKSQMPGEQRLLLELLKCDLGKQVTYDPLKFAGAVVCDATNKKIKMLAFYLGPIVCVGATDTSRTAYALEAMLPTLLAHTDTPENRARLARFQLPAPVVAPTRRPAANGPAEKRKRAAGETRTVHRKSKRPRVGGSHY